MRHSRRQLRIAAAVVLASAGSLVAASPLHAGPSGGSGPLKFTGKMTGEFGTSDLLIVAEDGSAVRAVADEKGAFSVSVPAAITETYRRGLGATVQVVSFGYYVGPVSLGSGKVWRLKSNLPAVVDLGTVKITDKGGSANVNPALVDRKSARLSTAFNRSLLTNKNDIWSSVGGDNDGDGLPNVFDRDSDGNGVPDGAQMSLDWKVSAKDVAKLNSKNVMTRSFGTPQFQATFKNDFRTSAPVNTNVNPSATLEELQAYQDAAMIFSAGSPLQSGRTVFFDCKGNYFCSSEGIVPVAADQGNPKGDYGHFDSALTLLGTGRLVPDGIVGILIEKKGNSVVSQRVGMVRSSIASPVIISTVGGVKQKYPLSAETSSTGSASFGSLTIEFYRPQELQTKPRLFMADRGGFIYSVQISGQGPPYFCAAENLTSSKQLIPISNEWDKGKRGQMFFDYDAKPKNGELLSFTIDVWGCLKNPSEGAVRPASGQPATIWIDASDWAGNRASAMFPFTMP